MRIGLHDRMSLGYREFLGSLRGEESTSRERNVGRDLLGIRRMSKEFQEELVSSTLTLIIRQP